jgi:hypothetical protein
MLRLFCPAGLRPRDDMSPIPSVLAGRLLRQCCNSAGVGHVGDAKHGIQPNVEILALLFRESFNVEVSRAWNGLQVGAL